MIDLKFNELVSVNGGIVSKVSNDPSVQQGYGVGWHIGHAIGSTVRQFFSTFKAPFE